MSYTVSYYIGHIEHQKDFDDFDKAHEFALNHWISLDEVTRDNYIGNGWNTCIVDYENLDEYDEPTVIVFE